MFDKNLIDRICNIECSYEEIQYVYKNAKKIEFDKDNPYQKYYSKDTFLKAISKYQNKEINSDYLALWTDVYSFVYCGGPYQYGAFCPKSKNIAQEMGDYWFDDVFEALSTCNDCEANETNDAMEDLKHHINLTHLLMSGDIVWNAYYTKALFSNFEVTNEYGEMVEGECGYFLFINDRDKEYMVLYSDIQKWDYEYFDDAFVIDRDSLQNKIEQLNNLHYVDLHFHELDSPSDFEDDEE